MEVKDLSEALKRKGYQVSVFKTKEDAADYIAGLFDGDIIGFGDSLTMTQMDLYNRLSEKNIVKDPNQYSGKRFLAAAKEALTADYFFTSVNAITKDGVIINIDCTGNRIAGSLFGHKKVFYIFGTNKITEDIESGVFRVRNVAAPLNAKRLNYKTPCAVKGDKCYDCNSPARICRGLLIQYRAMDDTESEAIIIEEELGI